MNCTGLALLQICNLNNILLYDNFLFAAGLLYVDDRSSQ